MILGNVSVYSLISAVIYFNVGIIVITILRRNTAFLVKYSTSVLMIMFICSIARILLPFDMSNAFVIESEMVFPSAIKILSEPVYRGVTIGAVMQVIWLMGAIIVLLRAVNGFRREVCKKNKYLVIEDEQINRIKEEPLLKKTIIIVSPDIAVPQVTGFLKAHIYIPLLSISDTDMKMILMHELQHFKGKDIFIKVFYVILKSFFWWNPVVHIFQQEVYNLLELRCDMKVTKNMDYESRLNYLESILRAIKQAGLKNEKTILNTSMLVNFDSKRELQQRFKIIIDREKLDSPIFKLGVWCFIILIFLSSYFFIIQPAYAPLENEPIWNENTNEDDGSFLIMYEDKYIELYVDNTFVRNVSKEELKEPPLSKYKIYKGDRQ